MFGRKRHKEILERLDHLEGTVARLLVENKAIRDACDSLLAEVHAVHARLSFNNRPKP